MKHSHPIGKWPLLLLAGSLTMVFAGEVWASSCWYESHHGTSEYHPYPRSHWHARHHRPYAYGRFWRGHYGYDRPVHHVKVVRACDDTVVINVPNANGSYTPVTLRRAGGSYVGPRGEYYTTMPTVEQLKGVYGLD